MKTRVGEARARLYRVALAWCGDEMLADDLVQDTVASGIANIRQLRDERRLFAWLYTILNNNWRQHLRRQKCHDELDEQMPGDGGEPLGCCQELELVARVRQAVATLPAEQRQVVALVDLEEFSYCDVAAILDIPIGTVMSRLHRARKNLLVALDGRTETERPHLKQLRVVK
jgi:RNA polymerase sigma-70 factor (ECF subfamily)